MRKKYFSRINEIVSIPDLIEVQNNSFNAFLQINTPKEKRKWQGLQSAFLDVFPIINIDGTLKLDFLDYTLEEPKYLPEEAVEKDTTYSMPLKIRTRLTCKKETNKPPVIKEQVVYLCNIPGMTDSGTFIINGAERVIVNQLHRSPGVVFEEDMELGTEKVKISIYGKKLYVGMIIPYRGSWIEFEFDINNALYVKIDKKRKIPATELLKAIGIEKKSDILSIFYKTRQISVGAGKHAAEELLGRIIAEDIVDDKGEMIAEANEDIDEAMLSKLLKMKVKEIKIIDVDPGIKGLTIHQTLKRDNVKSKPHAIMDIFKRLRTQAYIDEKSAKDFFDTLLFKTIRRYDLCDVGRYKINKKLKPILDSMKKELPTAIQTAIINSDYYVAEEDSKNIGAPSLKQRTLVAQDIIATIKYLVNLNNDVPGFTIDDIDHLGNRRVRSVGELLENQIRIGLSHMARLTREKMNMQNAEVITPRDILNMAPVVGVIRKFFGTSQLSQFMDQTNPLSELTHKRRLSALGPGGLNRKRAGFKVRDVHYSHYGRICPIETPEGPNIGLIVTLSLYSRINKYGLIETPYRKVVSGRVTDEIDFLTADMEDEYIIAQADAPIDSNGKFKIDMVITRCRGDFSYVNVMDIDYMDVSPKQLVSPSAGLIPFLEHDDANRALMGSNMQRQSIPLLITEAPLVMTGIEKTVARDSKVVIIARSGGVVKSVTAEKIVIWNDETGSDSRVDVYNLRKYYRSNQDTCMNQTPIVREGDRVKKGQVIADGPATSGGELALGKNLLVAFLSWDGYNFEDAIVLNERLVKEDVFTSVHIQEFQVDARDLAIGSEEITRDIPNVGEDSLSNLDSNGIIHVGAEVKPGDILVGKVTPKGESRATPEERLLKVIFGKKAEEVQDASLRVSPGAGGKVLKVQVFLRRVKMSKVVEETEKRAINEKYNKITDALNKEKKNLMQKAVSASEKNELEKIYEIRKTNEVKNARKKDLEILMHGDDLPVTVNKLVKVFIVTKRKVAVGDKLSGRHGNKGVVSRILPEEDMPHLPDGTAVDIILNPLSVPSRMNVGQILETQLGWAAKKQGVHMVCPIFDGANESDIERELKEAKLPLNSKTYLYDGRTGERMRSKVTVGYIYVLKLAHMVEDKMHARSIGPYSLITRQPLGGKAQFGGQRFGEMEVWALEGYGAAYALQELLTMKSDDVAGRTLIYERIVKGEPLESGGIPESFKVLIKELQALCMNVELLK